MHDAPVALRDFVLIEASFAEVVIHVASEYEVVAGHVLLTNAKHVSETLMRLGVLVDIESMSVEEPKLERVVLEETRICHISEAHLCFTEAGVLTPETQLALESWQSRVNPEASPRCDE